MGRFLGEIVGRSPDEIARVRAASRARKDKLLIQEQQNKLAEILGVTKNYISLIKIK